ncbi:hypothetical protein ATANTOWER_022865 [Ataeniobius toweri]|uniref:Uncharacterized protein n=1 Tax=Ataeniobius toweri TaxID=208326 RepID=A0ABU7C0Y2_9TELE|nr:hypothetical protein [Ataeniobius toweri]
MMGELMSELSISVRDEPYGLRSSAVLTGLQAFLLVPVICYANNKWKENSKLFQVVLGLIFVKKETSPSILSATPPFHILSSSQSLHFFHCLQSCFFSFIPTVFFIHSHPQPSPLVFYLLHPSY